MPRIPDEIVQQVLGATDIVDLIASYGLDLKRAGADFKTHCPFHNEKTPSFNVSPGRQSYRCFGCGEGGNAVGFVMAYENLPFPEALRKLASRASITIEEAEYDPQEDRRRRRLSRLKLLHNQAARFMHTLLLEDPAAEHARQYLKSRGYNREMAARWTVGWMPQKTNLFLDWAREAGFTGKELIRSGMTKLKDENNPRAGLWVRFGDRLMFPIHNERDDVIAFSGRKLREEQGGGKYINSPETPIFKKANVFFGLHKAIRHMRDYAVLCEGQLDVIACHEAGVENAVATQGTACTSEHARLLNRYTNTHKVVICYDSDPAGHDAAAKAFLELAAYGMDVRVANMPAGEDPDSLIKSAGSDAFRALLEESAEFFDYRLRYLAEENNLEDPGTKARVARELAPLLNALSDKNAQEASINFVATRLGLGPDGIRQTVVDAARRPTRHRERKEEVSVVASTPVDRELGILAALALQSHEVLDFLCDQTEQLLLGTEGREGEALLRSILTARPDVPEPAAVNTFLQKQTREDQATLLTVLEDPTPADPLTAATEILGKLAEQGILRQLEALGARLKSPGLTDGEAEDAIQQITELQRMRSEAKNP
ncbi:MAG: DNA primase [Roseibacillus sp.]|nr:DNA primase [Roseibacillus sp.]